MRIGRAIAVVVGIVVLVAVVFTGYALLTVTHSGDESLAQPAGAGTPPDLTAQMARGEYLTRAADCAACHTVPGGAAYAGGVPFKLPFGTIYSSNITADKETGIGSWSDTISCARCMPASTRMGVRCIRLFRTPRTPR